MLPAKPRHRTCHGLMTQSTERLAVNRKVSSQAVELLKERHSRATQPVASLPVSERIRIWNARSTPIRRSA